LYHFVNLFPNQQNNHYIQQHVQLDLCTFLKSR